MTLLERLAQGQSQMSNVVFNRDVRFGFMLTEAGIESWPIEIELHGSLDGLSATAGGKA
jgi:hypothetical protein